MLKRKYILSLAVLPVALYMACSSSDSGNVAGGVSEETNTVAGILVDGKGKPVAGMAVLARHASIDSISFTDTTNGDGKFAFPLSRQGVYGISANSDSVAFYQTINYQGERIDIEAALKRTATVQAVVAMDGNTAAENVEVRLPGSAWSVTTDSLGGFKLLNVPEGAYALQVISPDPIHYLDASFLLNVSVDASKLSGPLPSAVVSQLSEELLADAAIQGSATCSGEGCDGAATSCGNSASSCDGSAASCEDSTPCADGILQLPLSTEFGLVSWWPMDIVKVSGDSRTVVDARGHTDAILLYGSAEQDAGVSGKSLRFTSAEQFGVIEDDRGILDSLTELTLEAFINVSKDKDTSKRRNIVGKLGFGDAEDHDVFSLALVQDDCGASNPRLAFFLADGSGDTLSCSNAVVAKNDFEFDRWQHVVVVWNGENIKLYIDGRLDNQNETSVKQLLPSDEPIFFGKESLNLKLDDVRLGAKAITSADVLYRYYLRGGAL